MLKILTNKNIFVHVTANLHFYFKKQNTFQINNLNIRISLTAALNEYISKIASST